MSNGIASEKESGMGAFIFLFILLLLQTGCFAVIIISKCDHAVIRIYTGFVGIGLAVFPAFVRRVMVDNNDVKSTADAEYVNKISRWRRGAGFIIHLIITLVTPWALWFFKQNDGLTFIESVTPSAIMQIATGALGFFIAGCVAFVRDFKTAGTGFNIFKAVLLGSLVVYAGYISLPGLLHFGNWLSVVAGHDCRAFSDMLGSDVFWKYVAPTIGADALQWMVGFLISLYANIMAYRDGFLRKSTK